MRRIRVMVVDDSVVVRRILSDALSAVPDVEVVAVAANGEIAMARAAQTNPDVITLDVEMPDRSGLDVLTDLRLRFPLIPVIMFSALTERSAAVTLDALSRGAVDYVTKPSRVADRAAAMTHIQTELVPRLRALARVDGTAAEPVRQGEVQPLRPRPRAVKVELLAIGASTGGPNAIAEVMGRLGGPIGIPIVIVQHMPPVFTKLFAERLTDATGIACHEATADQVLQPGHAYVAPGGFHMSLVRRGMDVRVKLDQGPAENSVRPAVDVLFRSAAALYGRACLAAVLTGMGQDGLRGVEALRAEGAVVIAQDEATSVVWGMPGYVARAGLADAVLPLARIAPEILKRLRPADENAPSAWHSGAQDPAQTIR